MKILYETPNGEYCVVSFTYDGWKDVFGDLDGIYIFKKIQPKEESARIFRQEQSVKDCLAWLRKHNIISKDEFEQQVKNLCPKEILGEN